MSKNGSPCTLFEPNTLLKDGCYVKINVIITGFSADCPNVTDILTSRPVSIRPRAVGRRHNRLASYREWK